MVFKIGYAYGLYTFYGAFPAHQKYWAKSTNWMAKPFDNPDANICQCLVWPLLKQGYQQNDLTEWVFDVKFVHHKYN